MRTRLGVDVGGSGIKGAKEILDAGELLTKRFRIKTPQPATPQAVAETIAQVAEQADQAGEARFGCAVPSVVTDGIVRTAANIDRGWIDTDGAALIRDVVGRPVTLLNDADAAGYAEMRYGAGRDRTETRAMKRTFQPSNLVRKRRHGFRAH